jgi:hypothetical protein
VDARVVGSKPIRHPIKKPGNLFTGLFSYMVWMTFENVLPIAGPSKVRITMTTITTSTKIKAYSTNPWPFSRGLNNIFTSFLSI